MAHLRRQKLLRIFMTAPLLLQAAAGWAASSAGAAPVYSAEQNSAVQASSTESPLPVFELHSGFWGNLHHFL